MPPFQRGQSGNPKGRPKGSRNLATEFLTAIAQPAPVPAGQPDAPVTSKFQAVIRTQVDKAVQGDNRALEAVLHRMDSLEKEVRASNGLAFTSADREVIEEIHRRLADAPSRKES
jgi:hypothetical protein